MGGLSVEREVSPAHRRRASAGAARRWATTWWRSTCGKDVADAAAWPRRSTWPSSPSTAATARTAASRGCWSRCSSPTPARACSPRRWGWRRSSPSRSSSPTASPRRRTGPSTRAERALAGVESLPFPFPVVVKPSPRGLAASACTSARRRTPTRPRWRTRRSTPASLLVEQFIKGREVQGAVLDDEALGAIEIVPAREFYDYEAKYKAGSGTRYLFPAPLPAGPVRAGERGLPRRAPGAGLQGRHPLGRHRHAGRARCYAAGDEHAARG